MVCIVRPVLAVTLWVLKLLFKPVNCNSRSTSSEDLNWIKVAQDKAGRPSIGLD
jgi:hypothetical protein